MTDPSATEQKVAPPDRSNPLPRGLVIFQRIGVDFSHLSKIPPLFHNSVGDGSYDSMLSHGAASTFYEEKGGYLQRQKGTAQRIIGGKRNCLRNSSTIQIPNLSQW